jgi:hypothetical protein
LTRGFAPRDATRTSSQRPSLSKGRGLEHDGASYARLTADEVAELHDTLSGTGITDTDLRPFHDELVQSLGILRGTKSSLFVTAH